MIHALFDTNVILDLVLNRSGFAANATRLFQCIGETRLTGYMTASSVTDIYYISQREKDRVFAALAIRKLVSVLDVICVDGDTIRNALDSQVKDFEDAVQAQAAQSVSLDYIVTRNTTDFHYSPVPAISPVEMIQKLQ